jgi:hypothetical protein
VVILAADPNNMFKARLAATVPKARFTRAGSPTSTSNASCASMASSESVIAASGIAGDPSTSPTVISGASSSRTRPASWSSDSKTERASRECAAHATKWASAKERARAWASSRRHRGLCSGHSGRRPNKVEDQLRGPRRLVFTDFVVVALRGRLARVEALPARLLRATDANVRRAALTDAELGKA